MLPMQHRDTSDRPLPPNQPIYLHPRSWLSSYLSPAGDEPGARWIEGHDVSRRRRPLPPDRTLRPRVFTEVASCDRASDTPVARSWGRAALADGSRLRSFEPRPPLSFFREVKGKWAIRRVFLR